MPEAVIASACRTPIGKYGRTLRNVEAVKLGSIAVAEGIDGGADHGAGNVHLDLGAGDGVVEADLQGLGPAALVEDEGDEPPGGDGAQDKEEGRPEALQPRRQRRRPR